MPEEALTSLAVFDAYRQFAGQVQLLRSESSSRIEYLIPTNNIIVLDLYFNLTNKSNLTDRLSRNLIRFLIIWQWLTFWVTLQPSLYLNDLLDGVLCKHFIYFPIFSLLVYKHDFVRCVDFTHIAASNTASDGVTNQVTHRYIIQTNLYFCSFYSRN